MKKCTRVKNPCKLCLQTVTNKTGVQCKGACKRWAHFSCLNYTPGKIHDIKNGIITITCPCPTCNTAEPKEFLTNPPYTCENDMCPANIMPKCDNTSCPTNRGPITECLPKSSSTCPGQKGKCQSVVVDTCPSGCLPEGLKPPEPPSESGQPRPSGQSRPSGGKKTPESNKVPCNNKAPEPVTTKTPCCSNKPEPRVPAPCDPVPVKPVIKQIEGPKSPVRELSRQSSSGQRFSFPDKERKSERKELTYKDEKSERSRSIKKDRKDRTGRRSYSPSNSVGRGSPRRSSPGISPSRRPTGPNVKASPERVCCTETGSPCGGRDKKKSRVPPKRSGCWGTQNSYESQGLVNYETSKNSFQSGKTRSCSCLSSPAFSGVNVNIKMDNLGIMNECKKCYSDSAVSLAKDSQSKALLCTIHQLCSTVGHLSSQVKQLMCKMMAGVDSN